MLYTLKHLQNRRCKRLQINRDSNRCPAQHRHVKPTISPSDTKKQREQLSPRSSAAERSCWDSWSSGTSSSRPLRESCWNRDPGGQSWVRVWTRQRRWSGACLVTRDRPSWEAAQAGTRRHSCLWQTTSSSFNLKRANWIFRRWFLDWSQLFFFCRLCVFVFPPPPPEERSVFFRVKRFPVLLTPGAESPSDVTGKSSR